MKPTYIRLAEIESAMREALARENRTAEEIASYIAAQRMHGWLRHDLSQETRKIALLNYYIPPASGLAR